MASAVVRTGRSVSDCWIAAAWATRSLTEPALRFASRETVESAVAVGDDVTLGGGDADIREAGRLSAGVSQMDGPQHQHLAAHDRVAMPVAMIKNHRLNVGGQDRAKPVHHP